MDLLGRDTHPKAAAIQIALLRKASIARRVALASSLSGTAIRLSREALRDSMPQATEAEVLDRWVRLTYGPELATRVREHLRTRGR